MIQGLKERGRKMRKKLDEVVLIIGFGVNIGILSVVLFALAATYLAP